MSNLSPSVVLVAAIFVGAAGVGCGSSAPATSTAAAVSGPVDMHCDMNDMEIKQSIGICMVVDSGTASALSAADGSTIDSAADGGAGAADGGGTDSAATEAGTGTDAAAGTEAGAGDAAGTDAATTDAAGDASAPTSDFGATMYNSSGSDDDCKYDVKWTSTAVKENVGVTFDVNAIRRIDDKPAMGADVQLEVYLNDHHPTPSLDIPNHESAGGNYSVGPVIFDAPGRWTVRFHFYEMCSDDPEDSPHGHAAFYVDVP